MDRKVFLENLMTYIKENMNEENVRFFKKSIKFRKVNHLYGEIFFEHSRNFEGYTVYISIESKTLAKFFKEMYDSQNRKYNIHNISFEVICCMYSVAGAHYYHAPSLTSFEWGDAIKVPPSPEEADKIYPDVLRHLMSGYVSIIKAFMDMSPNVLEYLVKYPPHFEFKSLIAFYIIKVNKLPFNHPLVQKLFEFDDKVKENKNGLFTGFDLIFEDNPFDQEIKKRILNNEY